MKFSFHNENYLYGENENYEHFINSLAENIINVTRKNDNEACSISKNWSTQTAENLINEEVKFT